MILDISRFVETERPHWTALEKSLEWLEVNPDAKLTIGEVENLHTLYQRASADLVRVPDGEIRKYLEWLVSRAYAEIHEARERKRFRPWRWVSEEYPRAFRRHLRAFQLAAVLTLGGVAFGALALRVDPEAKSVIMPFEALQGSPADRVAKERADRGRHMDGQKSTFSAQLMTHNTQVALTTLALGMTFGFGTIVMLFYNGVILGAVAFDYIHAGQTVFLMGWLLPHGVIEIPAILVGGQAGLVIAYALIGWGSRVSRAERLRIVSRDVVALAGGAAMMLVWAGIVESFLSQYHEPVISYGTKIAFGLVEAALLTCYLAFAGKKSVVKGDTLTIRTPEGFEFGLPLAGPVSRMLALVVDLAVVITIGKVMQQILGPLGFLGADFSEAIKVVAYFAISLVYMAAAEWLWRGQTVGKRLLRLRVVDAGGLRLEPSQVIVRNLLRFIDALPALYLVGGIACLASRHRQRLGDLAAGTVVTRAPRLSRPDLDRILGGKFNSLAETRVLAARLRQKASPELGAIALEALLRRDEIEPRARLALFGDMASHFRSLVEYPPEVVEQLSDEQYVRDVAEILYRGTPSPQPVAKP